MPRSLDRPRATAPPLWLPGVLPMAPITRRFTLMTSASSPFRRTLCHNLTHPQFTRPGSPTPLRSRLQAPWALLLSILAIIQPSLSRSMPPLAAPFTRPQRSLKATGSWIARRSFLVCPTLQASASTRTARCGGCMITPQASCA
ncbi:hypothetical protein SDC9_199527 [bioreactor metagenome]|uniref:Uncharacterized protein n=1 Tax=bioreactor metagenome TaxID=1076179 RepID=A0A645IKT1_9ZZZZ